ncbi:MAG: Eco57I restriction-modification methylase domain-containing protein, partial [Fibrobacteraceae bacterium]|nr:Eco57I restriction-modification methylase domain-containing protein [Fibrobacteraceae bacterium]
MLFNEKYDRKTFVQFLKNSFLPEDFISEESFIQPMQSMVYSSAINKLGICESLDLVVYEIRHNSKNDARVGLSKEAFRFLANEWQDKALVVFVPEDSNDNYRFSLITIEKDESDSGRMIKHYSNPKRYSYFLGKGIACYTPNKYLNEKGRVKEKIENGKQITAFEDLKNRFSVEVLTEAFYSELSDWYAWAVNVVRFPNKLDDETDDDKYNHEAAIRLVTRLIFVWFLKQKHLIPEEFFDEDYIRENLIECFNPNEMENLFYKSEESKYYKAILQNLFFAMLNSPITKEGESELSERHFRSKRGDYDNNKLMRYESMFKNPQLFIELANRTVPFLNGGLFDCLDDKDNGNYVDGFSDRDKIKKSLIVPDYLFFGEKVGKDIDLSEWYGDKKKKKVSTRGIIDILKRYNFTVEENTPFDQEVSLDPELLGKVFENLLASYNPETQTTARNQTGSFYTPREIVQYMVDESLIAHLKCMVGEQFESEYRKLISYADEEILLTTEQKQQVMESIYHCKIFDPACGSGAFPVGMLQQMVHILSQLDPTNELWKEMMLDDAVRGSRNAFQVESKEEREERLKDIETSFDESLNNPDYARKLYLIENCIHGVDIQPIAIQISKLRFFISLVVDQKTNNDPTKNFGIRPLPNLEAKFVAANSLIPLGKVEANLGRTAEIIALEEKLKEANHKIFGAKTVQTKRKWKEHLEKLRAEMADKLADNGFLTKDAVNQMASWNMFDQNSAASFFDADWMFGIKDGFDIVIGNPPYVQLQNDGGKLRKMYEKCEFETFASTGDIYCLFYEKGYQLLKEGAHLCFITSNKWMRAGYGEKIRRFFVNKTNPMLLIDFGGVKVFKSATVDTNILLYSKNSRTQSTKCAVVSKQVKNSINNLSDFVQQQHTICTFTNEESWVILSPIEQSIKQKIESVGTPLKDWDIK